MLTLEDAGNTKIKCCRYGVIDYDAVHEFQSIVFICSLSNEVVHR